MDFSERIKKYRITNNLTQEELAKMLHISRQAISKYETGRAYPSIDVLQSIAELLNVSVDDLLSKKDLTKDIIETKDKYKKNKYIIIILMILVIIGICISIFAIVKVNKNDKNDNINENISFCGIVGIANDNYEKTKFNVNDYLDMKYFGCSKIYTDSSYFNSIMNLKDSYYSESPNYVYASGDIYLSKNAIKIDYYYVYYDLTEQEYFYENQMTVDVTNSLKTTSEFYDENNKIKYEFSFKCILIDELVEMKIIEYDDQTNKISETIIDNQKEYTISESCLYIVIEEKLKDLNDNYYTNKKIIFNDEINRTYSYTIKRTNEFLYANENIIIKK